MPERIHELKCRYPGSIPFTKDDEWVFFGRDNDIENLKTKINVEKLIVLYGKSGLGKTSLLNAGVLPKHENQYVIIPLRFGTHSSSDPKHPLDILEQQLAICCRKDSFLNRIESEDISFWQHIKNIQITSLNKPILIVFDQFEELFTYSKGLDEFAEAFAEVLYNQIPKNFQRALHLAESTKTFQLSNKDLQILERPIHIKALIAIRSDRMALLNRLSPHIPNILKNCYELKYLTPEQAEDAIVSPALKKGEFQSPPFTYQPEALQKMLAYLTKNGEKPVESFQLQILCQYIEKNIVRDGVDKEVKPVDLGNLAAIYHDFYDRTIKNIGSEQEQYRSRQLIEDGLIFEEEERRISLFEGQIDSQYGIGLELLKKIVDTHIIRREPHGEGYMYELSHDSLIAPILKAKDERRRKEVKRKKEEGRLKEEQDIRAEEERIRKEKEKQLRLEIAEQKAVYEAKSAQRMRLFLLVLGAAILIIFGALVQIYFLKQEQEDKLVVSTAKTLTDNSRKQIEQSSQLSFLLAKQAYDINLEAEDKMASKVINGLRQVLDQDYFIQMLKHDGIVGPVAFSPDGKTLVAGSVKGSVPVIYVWKMDDPGSEPEFLEGHSGQIYSMVFSPKGKYLASAGDDKTVCLWDLSFEKSRDKIKPHKIVAKELGKVWAVAFDSDERTLAVAGERNDIHESNDILLWDLNDRSATPKRLKGHTKEINALVFSPVDKRLASGGKDNKIMLWDLRNLHPNPLVFEGHMDTILSLAFDPDGKWLASGSYDKTVRLWELESLGINRHVFEGHEKAVRSVAFSPDRKRLASGSFDNTVRLWELDDKSAEPKVLKGHEDHIHSVAFSPNGDVLASGSRDNTARLWYLNQSPSFTRLRGLEGEIAAVAFSQDGSVLASGSLDNRVHLWDLREPNAQPILLNGESDVCAVAVSPNRRWLAVGSTDKAVRLWDLVHVYDDPILLRHHKDSVKAIAFSTDSRWLASGSADMTVCLWDLENLKAEPRVINAKWGKVYAVSFSPDNRWLAAGSDDMLVRIWDRNYLEKEPAVLRGHEKFVFAVNFSPDSKTLASGSADKTVRLWNVKKPYKDHVVLKGHESAITALAFSPDGNTLVSGSLDKTVKFWNLKSQDKEPIVLNGHKGIVHGLAVTQDGKKILSVGKDNTVVQWMASPDILSAKICETVKRNLSLNEWKQFIGPDRDYTKTCPDIPLHHSLKDYIIDLAKSGDLKGAFENVQRAKRLEPGFDLHIIKNLVKAVKEQGELRAEAGDVDGAIENFLKAKKDQNDLEFDPQQYAEKLHTAGLVKRGKESASEGDLFKALALFDEAVKSNPGLRDGIIEIKRQESETLDIKGRAAVGELNIKGALVLLEKASELNPDLHYNSENIIKIISEELFKKAVLLSMDGKEKQAIERFQKANELNHDLNIDPNTEYKKYYANRLILRGQMSAREGRRDEAVKLFKEAMYIDPNIILDPEQEAKNWSDSGRMNNSRH